MVKDESACLLSAKGLVNLLRDLVNRKLEENPTEFKFGQFLGLMGKLLSKKAQEFVTCNGEHIAIKINIVQLEKFCGQHGKYTNPLNNMLVETLKLCYRHRCAQGVYWVCLSTPSSADSPC